MNESLYGKGSEAKLKHVQACLKDDSQYEKSAGFEAIELENQTAAGLSLADISTECEFLGHKLKAPLMIAPMTGGMELGAMLNERWARAAHHFGLAMGVGSQRIALMDERLKTTFMVRSHAPHALLFANLGAAQLLQGMSADHALRAVEMIDANALFIHLNPLQEASKRGGDVSFFGLLRALRTLVEHLRVHKIPVLVREVGFGFSEASARRLIDIGISGIDCAGAGGTSWTKVEALCSEDQSFQRLGMIFGEWGIPTVQSIRNVRAVDQSIPLIASGGLRSGLDIAKALKLGADLGAMAQPLLKHALIGEEALFSFIEQLLLELRVALFAAGASSIAELKPMPPARRVVEVCGVHRPSSSQPFPEAF